MSAAKAAKALQWALRGTTADVRGLGILTIIEDVIGNVPTLTGTVTKGEII